MNQKGISSIVIILIVVGVLAAAGGVYYFAVQKPSQPEQPQPVLPPQPEKEPVTSTSPEAQQPSLPDETANWKTYRNEKYGFEVKYPANYQVMDYEVVPNKYIAPYISWDLYSPTDSLPKVAISLLKSKYSEYIEYLEEEGGKEFCGPEDTGIAYAAVEIYIGEKIGEKSENLSKCLKIAAGVSEEASETVRDPRHGEPLSDTRNINGRVFFKESWAEGGMGHFLGVVSYRIIYKNRCYDIALVDESLTHCAAIKPKFEEIKEDLEQILSTFRFIE